MKILVTGGGGFLGEAITRQLLGRGDQVIVYQRSSCPHLVAAGAGFVQGDILDTAILDLAVRHCDAVVHTAGKAGIWGSDEEYFSVNVEGTENVINACRRADVKRLVYTSSPSVIHGGGSIEGGDESLPYPKKYGAPYPATKALAEQMVMAADCPGMHTVSLRPHLIWGPGDRHLLPRLLQRAHGGVLRLPGGEKKVDTVYVDNAAHAHLLALDSLGRQPACHGKTYFISNDEPLPQAQIIRALLKAAGREVVIRPVPAGLARLAGALSEWLWTIGARDGEPPVTRWSAAQLCTAHWYNISAAKRDLGYRPRISIADGLERLRQYSLNYS